MDKIGNSPCPLCKQCYLVVEKQASGRQPRRAAFWKAQHIHCEHLQKPHNAGSRPQARFFNTRLESVAEQTTPPQAGGAHHQR